MFTKKSEYIKALLELSSTDVSINKSVALLNNCFKNISGLQDYIQSNIVDIQSKKKLLEDITDNITVIDIVLLLIQDGYGVYLGDFLSEYIDIIEDKEIFTLVSKEILSSDFLESFRSILKDVLKKDKFELENILDPSLDSGFLLKHGSKILDYTLKSRLDRLSLLIKE